MKLASNNNSNDSRAKSVGQLMTTAVPVGKCADTVETIRIALLSKDNTYDSINYIYVLDEANILKGTVSIKELMRHDGQVRLEEVMQTDIVSVHPQTDQERAGYLSLQHNIKAIPVVEQGGVFVGVVTSDVILAVLHTEMGEDLLHLAGMPTIGADARSASFFTVIKHRLPWLLIGLLGGVAAASLVSFFEETLRDYLILATFIPMVMYMGGSVLAQTQAFFIRDLAVNPNLDFGLYISRQAVVIASMGLVIGISIFLVALFVYNDLAVANILGVALFSVVLSTIFSSLLIPYTFHRLKFDPADGSGPIATIVQDLIGISIYFFVATTILQLV